MQNNPSVELPEGTEIIDLQKGSERKYNCVDGICNQIDLLRVNEGAVMDGSWMVILEFKISEK